MRDFPAAADVRNVDGIQEWKLIESERMAVRYGANQSILSCDNADGVH